MATSSHSSTWIIALKAVFLFLLIIFALLGLAVLYQASGSLLPLVIVAAVALLLGLAVAGLGHLLRRRRANTPFWRSWL